MSSRKETSERCRDLSSVTYIYIFFSSTCSYLIKSSDKGEISRGLWIHIQQQLKLCHDEVMSRKREEKSKRSQSYISESGSFVVRYTNEFTKCYL